MEVTPLLLVMDQKSEFMNVGSKDRNSLVFVLCLCNLKIFTGNELQARLNLTWSTLTGSKWGGTTHGLVYNRNQMRAGDLKRGWEQKVGGRREWVWWVVISNQQNVAQVSDWLMDCRCDSAPVEKVGHHQRAVVRGWYVHLVHKCLFN